MLAHEYPPPPAASISVSCVQTYWQKNIVHKARFCIKLAAYATSLTFNIWTSCPQTLQGQAVVKQLHRVCCVEGLKIPALILDVPYWKRGKCGSNVDNSYFCVCH